MISRNVNYSFIIFILGLGLGIFFALHKPLWNDELYTQILTIQPHSYKDILSSHFTEGNNNPLFYLLQKFNGDLWHFYYPHPFHPWMYELSPQALLILRIPSIFYIALSIALIFYFFIQYFSKWTALYSLLICLSTPSLIVFWVDARPYALWFLLTTIQLLVFLRLKIILPVTEKTYSKGLINSFNNCITFEPYNNNKPYQHHYY